VQSKLRADLDALVSGRGRETQEEITRLLKNISDLERVLAKRDEI
jgi:hypothetical protein